MAPNILLNINRSPIENLPDWEIVHNNKTWIVKISVRGDELLLENAIVYKCMGTFSHCLIIAIQLLLHSMIANYNNDNRQ